MNTEKCDRHSSRFLESRFLDKLKVFPSKLVNAMLPET